MHRPPRRRDTSRVCNSLRLLEPLTHIPLAEYEGGLTLVSTECSAMARD